jgi:4-hydroxy-3-methylbut-2-en-1-yl diphosphate synthase IspG/GcpE
MIRAYRMLSEKVPYPLHLGVTEAGTPYSGSIKSAVGIGALLVDGIGDTVRVSLTADPVEEVKAAYEILKALGLRERGPVMIACPSCGRDSTSRSPCSAARSTVRARRATPTSASPAAATSASSTPTGAC